MKKFKWNLITITDAVFLIIFIVFLFVPMSKMDFSEFSKEENKTLAKLEPVIQNKQLNLNFSKSFEEWFSDRFNLRTFMISTYCRIKYNLAQEYYEFKTSYINKNTNYIQLRYCIYAYAPDYALYDKIAKQISDLKLLCDKKNIKLYMILVPNKDSIATPLSYPYLKASNNNYKDQKFVNYIKDVTGMEIVYPYNELQKLMQTEFAYFKSDHHWTDKGAYIGYRMLMEQIKKDFPNIKISELEDFNIVKSKDVKISELYGAFEGQGYVDLHIEDKNVLDTEYEYLVHKKRSLISETHKYLDYSEENVYVNNAISAPNLYLYGDSFALGLLPSIITSFHNTKNFFSYAPTDYLKNHTADKLMDDILSNKTDVLVVCFYDINRFAHIFGD